MNDDEKREREGPLSDEELEDVDGGAKEKGLKRGVQEGAKKSRQPQEQETKRQDR